VAPQLESRLRKERLEALKQAVREKAVDYHRVQTDDDYERVLTEFLVGRTRARGVR
jgi:hypothetical protein